MILTILKDDVNILQHTEKTRHVLMLRIYDNDEKYCLCDRQVITGVLNERTVDNFLKNSDRIYLLDDINMLYKEVGVMNTVHKLINYLEHIILNYDSSSSVNEFYLGETPLWLDKATRVGLKLRFDYEIANGQTTTTLWQNGVPYPLELTSAIQMLGAIELYASQCYDRTQMHLAAIKLLNTEENLLNYDYKSGYPEKLRF